MTCRYLIWPTLALLLTGCGMVPDYQRPAVPTPAAWQAGGKQGAASAISADWWAAFQSPELNALMKAALSDNNDLRAGLQRIAQARASLKIAGAPLLPSASAAADSSKAFAGSDAAPARLRAGGGIAYELDLFGANRAAIARTRADLAGSEYSQGALALVIMGDVAQTYFSLLNARARLQIADQNLKNAREVLRIITVRVDAGSESGLELSQQKTAVATSEAARASLAQDITTAENALAVLLGQPPQTVVVKARRLDALKIPDLRPGQPSSLLARRPDIQAAEAGLIAAHADIGVARAAFFPTVNLGLDWTVAGSGLNNPAVTAATLASSLSAPLFQGGRLKGGLQKATARQEELAEIYRKTVLVSFREVEDALAAVKAAQRREEALGQAKRAAQTSYTLSKNRYEAGAIDFQTLLDTQKSLLAAEDGYAQATFDRLTAAVGLFKALGGGWTSPHQPKPAKAS